MRHALINKLADAMRQAENHYLNTGDDNKKWETLDKVRRADLTNEEFKEWVAICDSIAC